VALPPVIRRHLSGAALSATLGWTTNDTGRARNPRPLNRGDGDAFLDATARVLTRQGFDRASTNRIAATAGVSVGSLYQHFPNKEALVAALVARHNRKMLQLVRDALKEVASRDLATAMRELVRVTVDAHLVDSALHRIFAEQVPRMGQLAKIEALQRETFLLVRTYLEERRNEISVRDLDSATSICVTPSKP